MRLLDLFAGLGGFSLAAHRVGWETAAFCEINPFARRVLSKHWPEIPCFEDVTQLTADSLRAGGVGRIDAVSAGWPCQDLSVAGNRAGLAGQRSGLFYELVRLVDGLRPQWVIGENVPGLRSSWSPVEPPPRSLHLGGYTGGKRGICPGDYWNVEEESDLASVLLALSELGYSGAYRSLDAQYYGLAQRRERMLFVFGLGAAGRRAIQLILESGVWRPAPGRRAGEAAPCIPSRSTSGGGLGTDFDCDGGLITAAPLRANGPGTGRCGDSRGQDNLAVPPPITGNPYGDHESREGLLVTHALTAEGFDASEGGTGRGTPIVVTSSNMGRQGDVHRYDQTFALNVGDSPQVIAFNPQASGYIAKLGAGDKPTALQCTQVPAIAFDTTQITSVANRSNPQPGDPCHPLAASAHAPAVAFTERGRNGAAALETQEETAYALRAGRAGRAGDGVAAPGSQVRRLSPTECERLQGVSYRDPLTGEWLDGHTCLCGKNRGRSAASPGEEPCSCPDGPRYRILGNAVAVPVIEWLMRRVAEGSDGA